MHGDECALRVLKDLFWFPGRFVCIGSRTPAQGAYPIAVEALGLRNADLPGEWSLSTAHHTAHLAPVPSSEVPGEGTDGRHP